MIRHRASRNPTKIPKPGSCHPLVHQLCLELDRRGVQVKDVLKKAGIHQSTFYGWRTKYNPSISDLDACLNVLGYRLKIEKI